MICFPNAKINVGLNVLYKRKDNYHNIETCMLAVPLNDVLEIKEANKFSIDVFGENIERSVEDNILYKVWQKLIVNNKIPAFEVKLLKNIPIGAGLGGGSSNAAFFLKEINHHYNLNMSTKQMEEFLAEMGGDCPFFVNNGMAIASSKGDVLRPVKFNLNDVFVSIIVPTKRINTANAYSKVVVNKPDKPLETMLQLPFDEWRNHISNAFENFATAKVPIIAHIKDELYNAGASFVSLSGSGSAVYSFSHEELNIKSLEKQNFVWKSKLSF